MFSCRVLCFAQFIVFQCGGRFQGLYQLLLEILVFKTKDFVVVFWLELTREI